MALVLRDYQISVVEQVVYWLKKGKKRILIVVPTGGGKTAISTDLAKRCIARGKSSTFICHRSELLEQTYRTYTKNDIIPAFIQGGKRQDPKNPTQLASVNTLVNRLDQFTYPDVVFWDETHHVAAKQWGTIFKEYGDSVHIGLTATPWRLDGKALGDYYDVMILGEKTSVLMERGFLVYYDYYAPSSIDTSVLVKGNKEYTQKSLEDANFGSKIIGDNIQHYKKIAMGKRNVVFAMNIKHSQNIVNKYNNAGIPARHLDGDTGKAERKKVLKQFASGEILVLSNVDLFGEGFDLPEIEVVSLLRPTQSLSLFLQMVGRGFRPVYAENYPINTDEERLISISNSNKTKAIILDHANNYETHGMPDDDREWSLYKDAKVKRKKSDDDSISIKRCPNCYAMHKPSLNCPYCGFAYVVNGKDIKEVAGELVLHGTAEHKQAMIREVVTVTTFKGLVDIENSRKYKKGWAENKWKAKTGEDLKSSLAGYEKISQARGYKKGWAYTSWNIRRNR